MNKIKQTLKTAAWMCGLVLCSNSLLAQQPFGQWDFDAGNLNASVGPNMEYSDGVGGATQAETAFGTTTALGIPDIGGVVANVMKFGSNTATMGYQFNSSPNANGGGAFINDYTIIFDVLYPTGSDAKWRALLETDGRTVDPDADFFIDPSNGIGVSSQYSGVIAPNTWNRIGFVLDGTTRRIRKYINGVEVGSQSAGGVDGRWSLSLNAPVLLFTDNDGDVAPGFVNSIQYREVALTASQMRALGAPTASGIPQEIPPVPSFVEKWKPTGPLASRTTDLSVVINTGSTTIADNSIVFKLDGATLASPTITRDGDKITVFKANPAPFAVGSDHTLQVVYVDSLNGSQTNTHTFKAVLFYEDFNDIVLGPNVTEALAGTEVWSATPPTGWTVDHSGVPAYDDPAIGMTEWKGWTFADRDWWVQAAGDQDRSQFTKASGTVAVVDPDEWDDLGNPDGTVGYMTGKMQTPVIPLVGVAPNSVFMQFDSSWKPEGLDDTEPGGTQTNNQTAIIEVSYNGGPFTQIMFWDSASGSPTFHPDAPNESVTLQLSNPASATNAVIRFTLYNAANDWWWAVDNIALQAGAAPPQIATAPSTQEVTEGDAATFTVVATGDGLAYQWYKGQGTNKVAISTATSSTYTINPVTAADAGFYSVTVTNSAGSISSPTPEARLIVLERLVGTTIFSENFNSIPLGPNVDEALAGTNVWSKAGPAGWVVDDSGVPGAGTDQDGVTEWAGWSFADRVWWATAGGDQQRSLFTKGTGAIAIVDSDEWDDIGHAAGNMNAYLSTPAISLANALPNTVKVRFDSSWRAESPQKAVITASYDGGAEVEVMRWESVAGNFFHADGVNETVTLSLNNPAGAQNLVLKFGYLDTRNNWWWGFDNLVVVAQLEGGQTDLGNITATVAGGNITLNWTGGAGIKLQKSTSIGAGANWQDVAGSTGVSTITVPAGGATGFYRLIK